MVLPADGWVEMTGRRRQKLVDFVCLSVCRSLSLYRSVRSFLNLTQSTIVSHFKVRFKVKPSYSRNSFLFSLEQTDIRTNEQTHWLKEMGLWERLNGEDVIMCYGINKVGASCWLEGLLVDAGSIWCWAYSRPTKMALIKLERGVFWWREDGLSLGNKMVWEIQRGLNKREEKTSDGALATSCLRREECCAPFLLHLLVDVSLSSLTTYWLSVVSVVSLFSLARSLALSLAYQKTIASQNDTDYRFCCY